MEHSYKRNITHNDYSLIKKKYQGVHQIMFSNKIDKSILSVNFNQFDKQETLCVNENYLVFKLSENKLLFFWALSFILFTGPVALSLYELIFSRQEGEKNIFYLVILICFILFFSILFYFLKRPKKELIFDRNKGLLTFPDFMNKPNNTMLFKNVKWGSFTSGGIYSGYGPKSPDLTIISPKIGFYAYTFIPFFRKKLKNLAPFSENQTKETLSFFIWYMDKNRPLPPSEVFDEFREQDFERRKAEGFPKPMFPCTFKTPEYTTEQQAERLMIGGW